MADSLPMNPFQPGAGLQPGHMGRRQEIEDPLRNILDRLSTGQKEPRLAFLYGPRGNGKTVLLQWLDEQAKQIGRARPIAQIRLLPEHLESSEALIQRIHGALKQTPGLFDNLTVNLEAGIPGISVKVGSGTSPDPILGLSQWLEQDRYPVLLALDEAHEAVPAVLGRLLNAVQLAGQDRPVAAVLAGTPGLLDTLAASRASFWSRGERLPVGLLPDGEAQAVLEQPFLDAGLSADTGAVADLAEAADDYPYFLQLYGAAAWNAMRASGAGGLLPEHVPAAIQATATPRRQNYEDRYDEFRRESALPLARDVAQAVRAAGGRMTDAGVNAALARHEGDPAQMLSLLNAKGFIWRGDEKGGWTSGIPSLLDYMIEQTEPAPASDLDLPRPSSFE